jgi:pimeloyl-ACP methyl ester carboxylesterase
MNQSYARQVAPNRDVPRTPEENLSFRTEIVRQVQFITKMGPPQRETGIHVPDSVFDPVSFPRGDAIVVSDTGRDDPLIRRSIIHPLISAGYRVAAMDLRGWGETKPDLPAHQVSFEWEDFFAYRSLEIGRPLLGQRVKDLLAAASKRTTHQKWLVVGVGAGALVALHAAVIEPRIERLVTVGGLLSYGSLVADPLSKESLGSYLPGVIRAYDVRELYAALAPRRVLAVNPMSSQRKPVGTVEAWEQLDWARQVYEHNAAADLFQMETKVSSEKMREILEEWAGA